MKSFGLTLVGVGGAIYIFCNIVVNFIDWPIVEADSDAVALAGIIAVFMIIGLGVGVTGFFVFIYGLIAPYIILK